MNQEGNVRTMVVFLCIVVVCHYHALIKFTFAREKIIEKGGDSRLGRFLFENCQLNLSSRFMFPVGPELWIKIAG